MAWGLWVWWLYYDSGGGGGGARPDVCEPLCRRCTLKIAFPVSHGLKGIALHVYGVYRLAVMLYHCGISSFLDL